jgi:hypothetical protein
MNISVILGLWELASYWFMIYMAAGTWWMKPVVDFIEYWS